MLIIAIPLWVIAAVLIIRTFFFVKTKEKEGITTGILVERMPQAGHEWTIEHPFETEVMVQIIPNDPDCAGASFPYVEHLDRRPGKVHILFAREVEQYSAVIMGIPKEVE